MKTINIIILFLGLISCLHRENKSFSYPEYSQTSDTTFYFPKAFLLKNRLDSATLISMSELLKSEGERNLSFRPLENETIRLTYMPPISKSVIITITRKSITINSFGTKTLKPFTETEFKKINKYLDKYNYWSMNNTNGILEYLDGAAFLLESNRKNSYYFVYSEKPSGLFIDLCNYLLHYAD